MDYHSIRMPKLGHTKKAKLRVYHDSHLSGTYQPSNKATPQKLTARHNYSSSFSPNNQLLPINMPPSVRETLNRTEVINLTNKQKKLPSALPAQRPVNRQIMVEFRPERLVNSPDAKVEVLVSALHPKNTDQLDFLML